MTARRLHAEIHDVAQGGIPLLDGTGWFAAPDYLGMESVYDKITYNPQLGESRQWDFSAYVPHVVIIALGQNDNHPDDAYAAEHENGSFGKTECWYILDCPEKAELVVGHHAQTREELADMISRGCWDQLIRRIPIKKGDFIQIDPGTVHAITAGCMILETQQNSDITYRVYDYDRLTNGKPRELHVQKSIDVITVPAKSVADSVKHYADLPANQWQELIACPYYKVFKLTVKGSFEKEQDAPFLNVSVLEGSGTLNGQPVKKGDHFIVPAGYGMMQFAGDLELVASTVAG